MSEIENLYISISDIRERMLQNINNVIGPFGNSWKKLRDQDETFGVRIRGNVFGENSIQRIYDNYGNEFSLAIIYNGPFAGDLSIEVNCMFQNVMEEPATGNLYVVESSVILWIKSEHQNWYRGRQYFTERASRFTLHPIDKDVTRKIISFYTEDNIDLYNPTSDFYVFCEHASNMDIFNPDGVDKHYIYFDENHNIQDIQCCNNSAKDNWIVSNGIKIDHFGNMCGNSDEHNLSFMMKFGVF